MPYTSILDESLVNGHKNISEKDLPTAYCFDFVFMSPFHFSGRAGGSLHLLLKTIVMSELCVHQVVRSRLQEQGQMRNSGLQYDGVLDCIKKVFEKEGLAGFYRGCATNLLRTTPSAVITFTSYEMIHRFLLRVSPPDEKHSKPQPKPEGHVKSHKETIIYGDDPSNNHSSFVPLEKSDKLTH